jgi:uncharacterized membrane protein YedE/YeeE
VQPLAVVRFDRDFFEIQSRRRRRLIDRARGEVQQRVEQGTKQRTLNSCITVRIYGLGELDVLNHQVPWYIGGPILGLCAVAIRVLLNRRLGVTGGFSEVVERVSQRSRAFGWQAYVLGGIVVGGALFAIVAGGPDFHGYGWLTDTFTGSAEFLVAPILIVAGALIGFGAKTAGGCTAGNGLSGVSMGSLTSLAATATFFGTAIAVSFLIKAVI